MPSSRVECETCQGQGKFGKQRDRTCARCKGRGFRVIDSYDRKQREVGSEQTEPVERTSRIRCDACAGQGVHGNGRLCGYCSGQGHRFVAESSLVRAAASAFATPAELSKRERQYRQGSYAELEDALRWLERELPPLYSLTLRHLIYPNEVTIISPRIRERLEQACELLAHRLPAHIRVPGWARKDEESPVRGNGRWANGHAQAKRNDEIRALLEQGVSARELGERFGLSTKRIYDVGGGPRTDVRGRGQRSVRELL